jgi:hypothetical protein
MATGPTCLTGLFIDGSPIGSFAFPVDDAARAHLRLIYADRLAGVKDAARRAGRPFLKPLDDATFLLGALAGYIEKIGRRWDHSPIDDTVLAGDFVDMLMAGLAQRTEHLGQCRMLQVNLVSEADSTPDNISFAKWQVRGSEGENPAAMVTNIDMKGSWLLSAAQYSTFGRKETP